MNTQNGQGEEATFAASYLAPPSTSSAYRALRRATHWEHVDICPRPSSAVELATWPDEFLLSHNIDSSSNPGCGGGEEKGQDDPINYAMMGVTRRKVEAVDGFGYQPEYKDVLDLSLVMLTAGADSLTVMQSWINNWGATILNHRNSVCWSPLIMAIRNRARKVRSYLLQECVFLDNEKSNYCQGDDNGGASAVELGIPEASALGMRDLTVQLVEDYDTILPKHRRHPSGLSGTDIAYIFSALSGDVDWVAFWMDKVQDKQVGAAQGFGNILRYAVRGGNPKLVKFLFHKGIEQETVFDLEPLLEHSLCDVNMVRFLVEDVQLTLDGMNEDRQTLLEVALLGRHTETCHYLLDKVPGNVWAERGLKHPLASALRRWNAPSVCIRLLDGISLMDAQLMLRECLRAGNHQMARVLMEDFRAKMMIVPRGLQTGSLTLVEEAASSGSLQTVDFVLRKSPGSVNDKHTNGCNCLVTAAKSGSGEVFLRIAQAAPNLLDVLVGDGARNVFMVAAMCCSLRIFDVILEREFYEAHCRGKVCDVNSKDKYGKTVLFLAVQSGTVELVDRLLSCQGWLNIRECDSQYSVNNLFVNACEKETVVEILQCFERHGFSLRAQRERTVQALPGLSLTMTAAKSGTLFLSSEKSTIANFDMLRAIDARARLDVCNAKLFGSIVRNAPEWAVENRRLSSLVRHGFSNRVLASLGRPCGSKGSMLILEVLDRRDISLAKLFSTRISARNVYDNVLRVLNAMCGGRCPAHPTVLSRSEHFLAWIMENSVKSKLCHEEQAFVLIVKAVKAFVSVEMFQNLFPKPLRFSLKKLGPVILWAARGCQLRNLQFLVKLLRRPSALCEIIGEKGETVFTAALSTSQIRNGSSCYRRAIVQWLLRKHFGQEDIPSSLPASLIALGHLRLFDSLSSRFQNSLLLVRDSEAESIVRIACSSSHPRILAWVLRNLQPRYNTKASAQTPLHHAVSSGQSELVRCIFQAGHVSLDVPHAGQRVAELVACLDFIELQNSEESGMVVLLHAAASTGSLELVKCIIHCFPEISLDEATLFWACGRNNLALVTFVLREAPDLPLGTAIVRASELGNVEVLKLLLRESCTRTSGSMSAALDGEWIDDAVTTSIANKKWSCLEILAMDERISPRFRKLLEFCCDSSDQESALAILLSSSVGLRLAFTTTLPWQARNVSVKIDVLPVLIVGKEKGLPRSATEHIWSFAQRRVENSRKLRTQTKYFMENLSSYFDCRSKMQELSNETDPNGRLQCLELPNHSGGIKNPDGSYKSEYRQQNINGRPVATLEELINAAKAAKDTFKAFLLTAVKDCNLKDHSGAVKIASIKSAERCAEKAKNDYARRSPGPAESWLFDMTRGSIVCSTIEEIMNVVSWCSKEENSHVVACKKRFLNFTTSGYRDLLFVVRLQIPTGAGYFHHMCEVQVHHKQVSLLDRKLSSHGYYEYFRSYFSGGDSKAVARRMADLDKISNKGMLNESLIKEVDASQDAERMIRLADLFRVYLSEYDMAIRLLQNAIIVASKDGDDTLARAYNSIGRAFYEKGAFKMALTSHQQALAIEKSVLGENHPLTATSYFSIGAVLKEKGDYDQAKQHYMKAGRIRRRLHGRMHPDYASCCSSLGAVHREMGNFCDAICQFEKALKIMKFVDGDDNSETAAKCYSDMGLVLSQKGDYQQALHYHKMALHIRQSVLGSDHPQTAASFRNYGCALSKKVGCRRAQEQALECYRRALEIDESVFDDNHPEMAKSFNALATFFLEKGQFDKALVYAKKALEILDSVHAGHHPDKSASYSSIGLALYNMGEYDKALEHHKKALEIHESMLGHDHPDSATYYNCIGSVFQKKRHHAKALENFQRAKAQVRKPHDHPDIIMNIGRVLSDMGEYEKALNYFELVRDIVEAKLAKDDRKPVACKALIDQIRKNHKALHYFQTEHDKSLSQKGEDHWYTQKLHKWIAWMQTKEAP